MRDYEQTIRELRDPTYVYQFSRDFLKNMMDDAADAIVELQSYADLYKELTEKGQTVARKLIDAYPRWISVEERLPIRGARVLVTNGSFVCEAYLSTADNWIRGGIPLFYMTPTHWMPLPDPPVKEVAADG